MAGCPLEGYGLGKALVRGDMLSMLLILARVSRHLSGRSWLASDSTLAPSPSPASGLLPPRHLNNSRLRSSAGFTYIELMLALTLGALVMLGIAGLVQQTLQGRAYAKEKQTLAQEAQFAMQRMARAVGKTRRLMVPTPDRPATTWREHVREQSVPASPPETGSLYATAVLAITLDASVDRNGDGKADADNDGDGRIDEDWPADSTNDNKGGIIGIDDNGGGAADTTNNTPDDDEDGIIIIAPSTNEDPIDGKDNDSDGGVDEDPSADMNGDGFPGVKGVDDDGDGATDEGALTDDDEDGKSDEDWLDPVVFFLAGNTLMERTSVPWDTDGNTVVDGRDYVENPIASNVTRFRVEQVANSGYSTPLVDLTLELTGASGEKISLNTRVRVGGAL